MKQFKTIRSSSMAGDAFDKTIEILMNSGWEIVNVQCVSSGTYGLIYDVAYLAKDVEE